MASVSSYQKLFWTCSCSFEFVRTRSIAKGIAKSQLYRSVLYIWCCCVGLFFQFVDCFITMLNAAWDSWMKESQIIADYFFWNICATWKVMQWLLHTSCSIPCYWLARPLTFFLELLLFKVHIWKYYHKLPCVASVISHFMQVEHALVCSVKA